LGKSFFNFRFGVSEKARGEISKNELGFIRVGIAEELESAGFSLKQFAQTITAYISLGY
jgi:hypothetical protein